MIKSDGADIDELFASLEESLIPPTRAQQRAEALAEAAANAASVEATNRELRADRMGIPRPPPPERAEAPKATEPPVLPTPPGTGKAAPGRAFLPYAFPKAEISASITAASTEWLLQELDRLSNGWLGRGVRPYATVRDVLCQISLELNVRGSIAPRFRPMRRPRPKLTSLYPAEESQLSNDRQVIDLHWLRCRNARLRIENRRWEALGVAGPFDFDLASLFAATTGSPSVKADEILCITTFDQLQLATLQSKKLRKRWSVIAGGCDDKDGHPLGVKVVRRRLEDRALAVPAIGAHIETWVALWMCARLAQNLSPKQLAELYSLATGKPAIDPSNIRRKLDSMAKHLAA